MTTTISAPRRATSILFSLQQQSFRPLSQRNHILSAINFKSYSTQPPSSNVDEKTKELPPKEPSQPDEDGINGPLSTLPPPLNLPEKGDRSTPAHLFQIGRTYGKFYWNGVKATWANRKRAKALKAQIIAENRAAGLPNMPRPLLAHLEFYYENTGKQKLTRTDFQLLMREQYDTRKLPPFALMVALFGEWLPLIVPFVPSAVPRTCRIPKQIEDMRKGVEERRKKSFREGIATPKPAEDDEAAMPTSLAGGKKALPRLYTAMRTAQHLAKLGKPQSLHVSRVLGIGGRLFDSMGVHHPLFPVKLMRHLGYLHIDDELLLQDEVLSHLTLGAEETRIACEERGIDVTGRDESDLKEDLSKWLEGRKRDDGNYSEILKMLFTRPNVWGQSQVEAPKPTDN
ncbi:hypothetical protein E4T49_08365 [Aureobasidium sp. EXF-10728]|nr:hypothetical protein E4T49_08365 [Aureobasidium sp. EXF-10728]